MTCVPQAADLRNIRTCRQVVMVTHGVGKGVEGDPYRIVATFFEAPDEDNDQWIRLFTLDPYYGA